MTALQKMIGRATRHAFLVAVALGTSGCQSLVAKYILPSEGIRPAEYSVKIERDVAMTTSDGVSLVSDIYHPVTPMNTPTILVRIPFTKTIKNGIGADAIGRFWAQRGYTVVIQGSRGRFKSGGSYYPLRAERQDGIETLSWLKRQSWFDSRLGMWGGSVFGYTQWAIADQIDPAPQALMIQIASTDFYEMFHPGGAFSLESALFWAVRSRGERDVDPAFSDLERGFNGFPLIQADDRAVGDIPVFNDWATHATRDAYWKSIDGEQRTHTLQAPVLLMAGWYDPFLPTQLRDFDEIRRYAKPDVAKRSRLIIGPWTHADPVRFPDGSTAGDYRPASLAPSVAWFDEHLYQRAAAKPDAPVRLYVMGKNIWRDENEWPLSRARYVDYYLHSDGHANTAQGDGSLTTSPPVKNDPADTYEYDPRNPVPSHGGAMLGPRAGIALQNDVEQRTDVLVYTTATLMEDTEVTGPVRAILHVATSAPNTDFTAKLVDVHPDGKAYNISEGILRQPFSKNETTEITIDLWPTSMVFFRGHRIRLEISSSSFPRYDRNPNTTTPVATEAAPAKAQQHVFHTNTLSSRLILPILH